MRGRGRLEAVARLFRHRRAEPAEVRAARLLDGRRFIAAQTLVSAFYGALLFFALNELYTWPQYLAVTAVSPRWPVFWLRHVELAAGIRWLLACHLLVMLAAVPFCRHRWLRVLVFASSLEMLAFRFSFGSINHGDHLGVLLAFVLIFLPAGWAGFPAAGKRVRAATLLVFSGCQGMILLTYSMSGLWKVGGVVEQLLQGESTYLHPDGLARQVAAKLLGADASSLLGPWLIEHAWLGAPLMLAALYLEFFALWAVARPSLHRAWGTGLVLLHVSTHLTMGIGFAQNSLWLALFLVLSPLRPARRDLRRMLADLPVAGRWLATRRPMGTAPEAGAAAAP